MPLGVSEGEAATDLLPFAQAVAQVLVAEAAVVGDCEPVRLVPQPRAMAWGRCRCIR